MTIRYGNAENLKGMVEATDLLPALLVRGTKSMSRQQIQDALDKNRARLSLSGGGAPTMMPIGSPGLIVVSIETRRANLPAVLDILRQILREPTLPADEFEILKNEAIAGLEQGRTDPAILARNRLPRLMGHYAPDDVRYSPSIDEEIERVKATKLDQLQKLYNEYLGAGHGELAVVGDFEPSEVLPLVGKVLEGWNAKQPYARVEWSNPPDIKPEHVTIATPDKANATYLAAVALDVRDDDPDYAPLVVGNFIFGGGGLSSRLADRLRQKGGLSYGAASAFHASDLDRVARFLMMAICNPANLAKVETGATEELERWVKGGVTAEELERAKTGYLLQQQVSRSNDATLAAMLVGQLKDSRTMQFVADLERTIRGLKLETVNEAIRKHIDPSRAVSVAAGDVNAKDSSAGNEK